DEAAAWAHRNLPAKNKPMAADAKMVEERFQARLLQMDQQVSAKETSAAPPAPAGIPHGSTPAGLPHDVPTQSRASASLAVTPATLGANVMGRKRSPSSSVQALGKPVRLRDKDHRRYVLRQGCLVCGRVPSDPHHLTFTQPRALGRRVSDEFIVPVCRLHHGELHRSGDEVAWWQTLNIDPLPVALRLWQHTRADGELTPMIQAQTVKTADVKPAAQGAASEGASESGDPGAGNRAPAWGWPICSR